MRKFITLILLTLLPNVHFANILDDQKSTIQEPTEEYLNYLVQKDLIDTHPLNALYSNKEFLLQYYYPNDFLEFLLKHSIISYNHSGYEIDQNVAEKQRELLTLVIQQGANLNETLGYRIGIDTLDFNQDIFLKEVGPSKFLLLVVNSRVKLNPQSIALQLKLAQLALNLGADPNFEAANGLNITLSSAYEHVLELMKLLIDHGAKRTLNTRRLEELIAGGLSHAISDPQWMLDQKYKNLETPTALEPKMPYILHHIWLTHSRAPKEISTEDIDNIIATKNIFSSAPVEWQHIIWTNNPQLFPKSVAKLANEGILIKSIYEYQESLKLFPLIESLIKDQLWGKASDTLRISLIEYFGGVYADLNYIFQREVTSDVHKYHFFTSTYNDLYIANFFFGSCANHPILQKALSLIERNLTNPPDYFQSIRLVKNKTIFATANPLYLAYYSQANQNNNIDIIYPSTAYFRNLILYPNGKEKKEPSAKTPHYEEVQNLLKTICPLTSFDEYIKANEISGKEEHFIGYDSPDGDTWL